MPVTTVEAFLDHLQQSNLLSADAWKDVQAQTERASADVSPEQIARQLVENKLLTHWQASMLLAGRNAFFLGRYKLLDQLGQGGMGAVFRAEQIPLGRIVAVKVMAKKLVKDENAVARFRREIEAAAALNHPNVVTALDADEVDGTHFLVMDYVRGEDLGAMIKGGKRLPLGEACEYIRQAALGLQHAFEKGLVHRDIKPSNLLLRVESRELRDEGQDSASQLSTFDSRPMIKILDMGLAKFENETAEDGGLTSTGQIMGTPDYISPEQSRNTKNADIRSDIYSLGCTLFRLLAGRLPFTGNNAIEKITARLMEDAPLLRSLCPEAPLELEAVLKKMLTRDPAARFQTPIEVADALSPFAKLPMASGGRQSPGNATLRNRPRH
ncbi:MAG: serine/threonine protein kinase [Planctomycetes bacterium]|nr:serine/threonine protein kinase [Planctomycetota bacterium]